MKKQTAQWMGDGLAWLMELVATAIQESWVLPLKGAHHGQRFCHSQRTLPTIEGAELWSRRLQDAGDAQRLPTFAVMQDTMLVRECANAPCV